MSKPEDREEPEAPGIMSLREWYAGLAMQGMLAADNGLRSSPENIVVTAFNMADLMMLERDKRNRLPGVEKRGD